MTVASEATVDSHLAIQEKFMTTRRELFGSLLEREGEVDAVLVAMLCGENVVLVGDPGTAKSMMADLIAQWCNFRRKFKILCNRMTERDEMFGPISVQALKEGRYERITDNTLVDAEVAFLDEIFKASSAILNATLRVLNEHEYDDGKRLIKCPLQICIAASNEWPMEAKELGALFDRFLIRKTVENISSELSIERLMYSDITPELSTELSLDELTEAQDCVRRIPVSDEAAELMQEIRRRLNEEKIFFGDRRLQKSVRAVRAYAFLRGQSEVKRDDLSILAHIWWSHPDQQPKVQQAIHEIAKPSGMAAVTELADANEIYRGVDRKETYSVATATTKLADIARRLESVETLEAEIVIGKVKDMCRALRRSRLGLED